MEQLGTPWTVLEGRLFVITIWTGRGSGQSISRRDARKTSASVAAETVFAEGHSSLLAAPNMLAVFHWPPHLSSCKLSALGATIVRVHVRGDSTLIEINKEPWRDTGNLVPPHGTFRISLGQPIFGEITFTRYALIWKVFLYIAAF